MLATNIPYLYSRNGIYYYRNQSIWKSLKTKCKLQAFKLLCKHMSASGDKSPLLVTAAVASIPLKAESIPIVAKATHELVNAYLKENSPRWCKREVTRITSCLKFLPDILPTREIAIKLKQSILETKTSTTFNRYLKYFNAFYKWIIANDHLITSNPFTGLRILEKKVSVASKRNAYSSEQLKTLIKFADGYGNKDRRYWLILIARYTGARMNEICQLKPEDITKEVIHIKGAQLKTANAKRTIPIHPKLIELGILDWVKRCSKGRLFHEWRVVKGSHSHAASRWFSRNNPFDKSKPDYVDFHSIRHTVATEFKQAGIELQYAAQILGHSTGSITYDRYGKSIAPIELIETINMLGLLDT
jgi:integrase